MSKDLIELLKSLLKENLLLIKLFKEQPRTEEELKFIEELEKKKKEKLEKLEKGEVEIERTNEPYYIKIY